MHAPEEIDEIDAYLHLRKQRQERGELPKPDYTPPFVKKFGQAILGKRTPPKPLLKSMQPTYASAEAQAVMRKQIETVKDSQAKKIGETNSLQEKTPPKKEVSPSADVRTAPFVPPWVQQTPVLGKEKSDAYSSMPFAPVQTNTPSGRTTPSTSIPISNHPPSLWERFQQFMSAKPSTNTAIPKSTLQDSAPSPRRVLQPVVPLMSVARQPGYKPIEAVKGNDSQTYSREMAPIKAVIQNPREQQNETAPPSLPLSKDENAYALAPAPSLPANQMNAPPWVKRSIPSSSASTPIAEAVGKGALADLPWISAKEAARQQSYQQYLNTSKNSTISPTGAIASSMKSAGVKMPLNTSTSTPEPLPARLKPWVSGEVNLEENEKEEKDEKEIEGIKIEEEIKPTQQKESTAPPSSSPQLDSIASAREEEISEEEALEQLPFDDVEGLTDSDLDYLERKEHEHREQEAKKDRDYVTPEELKERLRQQAVRMTAILPDEPANAQPAPNPPPTTAQQPPPEDEKQAILRRLKKIMEEPGEEAPNNPAK